MHGVSLSAYECSNGQQVKTDKTQHLKPKCLKTIKSMLTKYVKISCYWKLVVYRIPKTKRLLSIQEVCSGCQLPLQYFEAFALVYCATISPSAG